jgi:hypothetical protein
MRNRIGEDLSDHKLRDIGSRRHAQAIVTNTVHGVQVLLCQRKQLLKLRKK